MPCAFVSNGLVMPLPNETFDFVWNSFANQEGFDMSSSVGEGDETVASVGKPANAEWRKQDAGYYNNKPNDNDYFKSITKRGRNNAVCATRFCCKLQIKLDKAQNEEVPDVLGASSSLVMILRKISIII